MSELKYLTIGFTAWLMFFFTPVVGIGTIYGIFVLFSRNLLSLIPGTALAIIAGIIWINAFCNLANKL